MSEVVLFLIRTKAAEIVKAFVFMILWSRPNNDMRSIIVPNGNIMCVKIILLFRGNIEKSPLNP